MARTPFFSTWRGQLIAAAFAGFSVWDFRRLDRLSESTSEILRLFILQAALFGLILWVLHAAYMRYRRPKPTQ